MQNRLRAPAAIRSHCATCCQFPPGAKRYTQPLVLRANRSSPAAIAVSLPPMISHYEPRFRIRVRWSFDSEYTVPLESMVNCAAEPDSGVQPVGSSRHRLFDSVLNVRSAPANTRSPEPMPCVYGLYGMCRLTVPLAAD